MNCNAINAKLSAYADGELTGTEMMEVRQHLSRCRACAQEYRLVCELKSMISAMSIPPPREHLEDRLLSAIAQADAQKSRFPWRPIVMFAGLGTASAAATLAIIALSPKPPQGQDPESTPIALEIQRDQIYSVGIDPMAGSPTVSTTHAIAP
jgi:hypothetical protein